MVLINVHFQFLYKINQNKKDKKSKVIKKKQYYDYQRQNIQRIFVRVAQTPMAIMETNPGKTVDLKADDDELLFEVALSTSELGSSWEFSYVGCWPISPLPILTQWP